MQEPVQSLWSLQHSICFNTGHVVGKGDCCSSEAQRESTRYPHVCKQSEQEL